MAGVVPVGVVVAAPAGAAMTRSVPLPAWRPLTGSRYSCLLIPSFAVSFAVLPGLMTAVFTPAHLLALPPSGLEQTWKACGSLPAFVTWKVTVPAGTLAGLIVNDASRGLPTVTLTTAAGVAVHAAIGDATAAQAATAIALRSASCRDWSSCRPLPIHPCFAADGGDVFTNCAVTR